MPQKHTLVTPPVITKPEISGASSFARNRLPAVTIPQVFGAPSVGPAIDLHGSAGGAVLVTGSPSQLMCITQIFCFCMR
jgi:hypothetical protein